jgi:calcium-dependent protein kinase
MTGLSGFVGGYYVGKLIHETDNSIVYESYHESKCLKLAIKAIKRSVQSPQMIDEEVSLMRAITHPNIMGFIDEIDLDEYKCLIMPLAIGGDLYSFIVDHLDQKRRVPEEVACKIMYSILSALNYLHNTGIWHRDIKPENVLIFGDDKQNPDVRIADFGYAKRFGPGETSNERLGSKLYAAPEIYKGKEYTEKIDMWSTGVLMYVLLSGTSPFSEYSDGTPVVEEIINGEYDLDTDEFENVSEEAKDLIKNLMELDPDNRLSAEEALENSWFYNFFPDHNLSQDKRKLARFTVSQAIDHAGEFISDDDDDDDDAIAY